jgi:threonine dehydrogenase-like Zn-dependent dehydrogenase
MSANLDLNWPATKPGDIRDGSRVQWSGTMRALVYFGRERFEIVDDRPIVCTEHDVVARVEQVYRCGTDVKIFAKGRPDQCEESLLNELRAIFGTRAPAYDRHFAKYATLLLDGQPVAPEGDALLEHIADRVADASPEQRCRLSGAMRKHWGRILGHETLVTIERVGSRVRELTDGIGYMQGRRLSDEYLAFQPGDRCVLQSRIAYYEPPPIPDPDVAGVQLLGGNITDLAMNLGGAYAQRVRLTPEIIQSGSVLRVPNGVEIPTSAMAEPTACLLDCFQKTTHELGQSRGGSLLHKGVRPGGTTCVIGSGAMAIMAAMMALVDDETTGLAPAAEIVVVTRSHDKARLVRDICDDSRVVPLVCADESRLPQLLSEQYGPQYQRRVGRPFRGFDDVILGAGGPETVAVAHRLIAPTGARVMTFAGTRGECTLESGVWHYGNAGVLGTSGCNTKMMEVALGLFQRGKLPVERLAGRAYTFADLESPDGIRAFFEDKLLRPYLRPND